MEFEWDPQKAGANLRRHRVSFIEAAGALEDPLSTTFPDDIHTEQEVRFVTIGLSSRGRLVVVAHTERNDTIRIIQRQVGNEARASIL